MHQVVRHTGTRRSMLGRAIRTLLARKYTIRPTQSLSECLDIANAEIYTKSHGFASNRAHQFFSRDGRIERVSEYMKKHFGLTRFHYIGCGDNAIVVRFTQSQALRICGPAVPGEVNTYNVPKAPFICPIWREIEFEGARLNFVPYVPSVAVSVSSGLIARAVAEEYIFALLRAGFENRPPLWFYDYKNYDHKFEQIGLLADGTPIIIDQGSVILEADTPKERFDRLAEDKKQVSTRPISSIPFWDGTWFDKQGRQKIEALAKPDSRIMPCPPA